MSIFCMTWNTQSVRLGSTCSSLDGFAQDLSLLEESWSDMSYKRYDPDFLPQLCRKIDESNCDWFVCALQESAKPGSQFMSDALPNAMKSLGFNLLRRNRMMGVGATSFQTLFKTGGLLTRGLRLAVYAKQSWCEQNHYVIDENWWHATPSDLLTRGKGALAICIYVRNLGRVCLLNCHLPFDAKSVAEDNDIRVTQGMSHQAQTMRSLVDRCCAAHSPHYLIVLGDLNFRVLNKSDGKLDPDSIYDALAHSAESRAQVFEQKDELRIAINHNALPQFVEGVDNCGAATFMPTGKMRHGRESGSTQRNAYFFGKHAEQNPSWCDRVLHAKVSEMQGCKSDCNKGEGNGKIKCTHYDRFECGQSMTRSDHTAVTSLIAIEYCNFARTQKVDQVKSTDSPVLLFNDMHDCSTDLIE